VAARKTVSITASTASRAAEPTVRSGAGTPGWMAPEQIRFAAPHVGPATDLYALGCILFAHARGQRAVHGHQRRAVVAAQERARPRLRGDPAGRAPETRAVRASKLMAKRPWHRYELRGRRAARVAHVQAAEGSATKDPRRSRAVARPCKAARRHAAPRDRLPERASPVPTTTGLLSLRPSPFLALRPTPVRRASVHQANAPPALPWQGRAISTARRVPPSVERARQRLVLLGGEAGVGKSRLADWLCEEVHERA
jgi:serine/threonine protein kinase